jgi:hypothetical protein
VGIFCQQSRNISSKLASFLGLGDGDEKDKKDGPATFVFGSCPSNFLGPLPRFDPPKPITTSPSDMQVRCDAMLCRFQLLVHFFIEFGVLLSFCQILELGLFS